VHPKPQHGQGLGQAFAQAGGDPRVGLVQLAGQGLELRLGEQQAGPLEHHSSGNAATFNGLAGQQER